MKYIWQVTHLNLQTLIILYCEGYNWTVENTLLGIVWARTFISFSPGRLQCVMSVTTNLLARWEVFFFDQSTKEICKLTTVDGSELPICLLFIRNSTTWLIRLKGLQATWVSDKYPRRNKWPNSDWKHVTNLLHSASRTCLDGLSVCLVYVRLPPILQKVSGSKLLGFPCWQDLGLVFKLHCKRHSTGELQYTLLERQRCRRGWRSV